MLKACPMSMIAALLALPLAALAQGQVSVEAEAGLITAPFAVTNGCLCQMWGTNFTQGGRAEYVINLVEPGDYVILATVSSPERVGSLGVNIDAEPTAPGMIWDIPVSQDFTNRTVTWREVASTNSPPHRKVFRLSAGPHQLILRAGEEAGVRLDRISLARIPSPPLPPGNLRVVTTP